MKPGTPGAGQRTQQTKANKNAMRDLHASPKLYSQTKRRRNSTTSSFLQLQPVVHHVSPQVASVVAAPTPFAMWHLPISYQPIRWTGCVDGAINIVREALANHRGWWW